MNLLTVPLQAVRAHGITAVAIACTALLAYQHVQVVQTAQQVVVPSIASVVDLEHTRNVLQEQTELVELQSALESDQLEQQVEAFVLPAVLDLDRTVALFDVMQQHGAQQGYAGTEATIEVNGSTITIELDLHQNALENWLQLVEIAGVLTVYDALTADQRRALLTYSQQYNPTALPEVEAWLQLSLFEYGRDADLYTRRLLRSFNDAAFEELLLVLTETPQLTAATTLFSGSLGEVLQQHSLWPLPFMQLESLRMQAGSTPGWYKTKWVLQVGSL